MKPLCDCGASADWVYMPGYGNGGSPYHCDNCVPRGCTCHYNDIRNKEIYEAPKEGQCFKWIVEGVTWTPLDEKGREYPCVEFDFIQEGDYDDVES